MKKNVLIAVALFATMAVNAQSIAAVSPSNVTTMYQTLDDAVTKAEDGSIIYLPGGGFKVSGDTKIKKQLTIMGVSHRIDADNEDGATVVAGDLNFEGGSSGSSVVGAFISGNINVGTVEDKVTNFTVRFCNVNSIQVKNGNSSGMIVNQCYLRGNSNFGECNVRLENNILHSVQYINGGVINHNIITTYANIGGSYYSLYKIYNSAITNNFLLDSWARNTYSCDVSNNCIGSSTWGENPIQWGEGGKWDNVFEKNKGISINSNFKLKSDVGKNAGTDGTDLGIYGGSGFNDDKSLAPIPRIVSKKVDEHTDGSGMLHIEVKVKAD